ncbi:MAG: alpha/beta fold hydrolase [Chromatiales bacterium]|jgi:pimeloyl-ACP methyl ester carboxylesterase
MSEDENAMDRGLARARRARVPPLLRIYRFAFRRVGPVFPGLLARLMERLWFQVHPRPLPAREDRWLRSAQESTLAFETGPLALYRWGEGPTVLLLHGWGGRASQLGAFAQPLVEAGFGVLAIDAPAHGRSPGRATSIFKIVEALLRLDHEHGPFVAAVTHSFGGMCLGVAVERGLRVRRAVLICAPAGMVFLLERFASIVQAPPAVVERFEQRLQRRFGDDLRSRIDTERVATRMRIPALIVHDADDQDVPLEQGERVAVAWPGAEFMRTEGLGHSRVLRSPQVLERVVDFVRAGRAPTR